MARNETDREDLLREATALVERTELSLANRAEPVVVGFRRDGSASCFFGADPVYQFNALDELRRAFVAGRLIKAEQGRLLGLTRHRTAGEVALLRAELTDGEQAALLEQARQELEELSTAIESHSYELIGQVPAGVDIIGRIRRWLAARPREIAIAARPNVR